MYLSEEQSNSRGYDKYEKSMLLVNTFTSCSTPKLDVLLNVNARIKRVILLSHELCTVQYILDEGADRLNDR